MGRLLVVLLEGCDLRACDSSGMICVCVWPICRPLIVRCESVHDSESCPVLLVGDSSGMIHVSNWLICWPVFRYDSCQ